ncbi:MAG: FMN-binding protein [Spirochaetaceae bacterium]|jgi:electron transport complex protein RnfG|nr:FMN-binding protein [Spirochaetaceae bacterium]
MLKLGAALALYATAACVGLAFVYEATKEPIAQGAAKAQQEALNELFPEADGFEPITGTLQSTDPAIAFGTGFAALKGGDVVGAALEASGPSYGGPVRIMVGVGTDGKITRIKILEHSDTPGLGANATKESFYGQFSRKPVSDPFEAKNDVAAITASTVTTKAVAAAVKAAGQAGSSWLASRTGGAR